MSSTAGSLPGAGFVFSHHMLDVKVNLVDNETNLDFRLNTIKLVDSEFWRSVGNFEEWYQ